VKILDHTFYKALIEIKKQFNEFYPNLSNKSSQLIVHQLVNNISPDTQKNAMLFSGGVDAFTTFLRHNSEYLDLITIRGADMETGDSKQWNEVIKYNNSTEAISKNEKHYITSNLRAFISFEVDKLLPTLGWWGMVQHGIALTALTAPLSYTKGYNNVYIASSNPRKEGYGIVIMGSMPEIDNCMKWGNNTQVIHDGVELTRQEKVDFIINKTKNQIKPLLRVCYSDIKSTLNCSVCEKCLRTILAIMIAGGNPNEYGFNISIDIFNRLNITVLNGYQTPGIQSDWKEIYKASQLTKNYFNISDPEWKIQYKIFLTNFKESFNIPLVQTKNRKKLKQQLISKFPKLFKIYLKIRRTLK